MCFILTATFKGLIVPCDKKKSFKYKTFQLLKCPVRGKNINNINLSQKNIDYEPRTLFFKTFV